MRCPGPVMSDILIDGRQRAIEDDIGHQAIRRRRHFPRFQIRGKLIFGKQTVLSRSIQSRLH
jgi:hypothetical protein